MFFFLNGFMGSGKSHWGQIWAAKYKLNFIDLDKVIEMQEGMSVVDIFEKHGEEHFRTVESSVLRTIANEMKNTIVACGGGTCCSDENIKWMNEKGITVYLSCTPEEILRRLSKAQDHRPLINKLSKAELLYFIDKKLAERKSFYNQCNITIPSEEVTELSFEEKILPY